MVAAALAHGCVPCWRSATSIAFALLVGSIRFRQTRLYRPYRRRTNGLDPV
jgi:hypothetical protein